MLLDTNSVIDFINGNLPLSGKLFLENIIPQISVITKIELLSNSNLSFEETEQIELFLKFATIHDKISNEICRNTILIRKIQKIKIPDAVIASTALVNNLTLVTRNINDFKNIPNLKLINPHQI